jgi:hypothetical protein
MLRPNDEQALWERCEAELRVEFPAFRIVRKSESGLSRLIDVLLKAVTVGGQRRYMTHYHTVIGKTLYVPPTWAHMRAIDRIILLRHERVHLRQSRRYGFGLMAFLYLVPFFPLGLAYGRARFEWEAYEETIRATAEYYGLDSVKNGTLKANIVRRFTGPDYGWMWPFPNVVGRWYDRAVEAIEQGSS